MAAPARLLALPLLAMGSPTSAPGPPPALLPGKVCESEGVGTSFFAQSWSNTCECASFPPQQPGDQCNWWTQPCGYCCQTCNASQPGAIKCKSFDNIMMLPGKANAHFRPTQIVWKRLPPAAKRWAMATQS